MPKIAGFYVGNNPYLHGYPHNVFHHPDDGVDSNYYIYNNFGACIGATALGAKCIEFHITKDRTMYGSDQIASIESVSELMTNIRKVEKMLGDGSKVVYDSERPIIDKLRKVNDL